MDTYCTILGHSCSYYLISSTLSFYFTSLKPLALSLHTALIESARALSILSPFILTVILDKMPPDYDPPNPLWTVPPSSSSIHNNGFMELNDDDYDYDGDVDDDDDDDVFETEPNFDTNAVFL